MQFLEMVIMETLRIYPPATRFDRSAEEDYQIGDLKIPKGTNIAIPVYVLHHSEEYWPEPEEFRPERQVSAPQGPS